MKCLKAILGYTFAVVCIIVTVVTFVGNRYFGKILIDETGLSISPWITGGEVVRTINHGKYKTAIHQTVFMGLFSERDEGFVQIDWIEAPSLPDTIVEEIDYDGDDKADFKVEYTTGLDKVQITSTNPHVQPQVTTFKRDLGYTIRVGLNNPRG